MKEELEKEKTALEVEKLKAEIHALKHPYFHNPAYIATVIFAMGALFTALINWNTVKTKENLDKNLLRLKEEIALKNEEIHQIEENILNYQKEALNLREANNAVRQLAHGKLQLSPEDKGVVSKAENANYLVAFLSHNISTSKHKEIERMIELQGYNLLRQSAMVSEKPPWFSPKSTVLYYDDQNRVKAEVLALLLEEKTGTKFVTTKGAGRGVQKGRERWSLVIHHLND